MIILYKHSMNTQRELSMLCKYAQKSANERIRK